MIQARSLNQSLLRRHGIFRFSSPSQESWLLYNLAQDPQERHNLRLQEPAQAETLRTLLARHFAADAQGLGAAAGADSQMAGEDLAVVEERLRELGYLD